MDLNVFGNNENKCDNNMEKCNCRETNNENKCETDRGEKASCHSCDNTAEAVKKLENHRGEHGDKHEDEHEHEGCSCSCHDHGEGGCGCGCDHDNDKGISGGQILTYIIGALVLLLAFLGEFGQFNKWAAIACAALVYIFFGKEVWVGAYKNVKNKKFFTEFSLMCVASLGAIGLGEFADAAAVIYLYSLGEAVSGEAYRKSKENISSLIEITEENVTVVKDKKATTVPASSVKIGDVISVRVGDRISLDGVVISGNGFADTSAVTGESLPVELSRGSRCLAGSSLVSGAVYVGVTERYENSTASKLKRAVERASKQKARREKRITRFAGIFTPLAFGVSVAVLALGLVVTRNFGAALRPALVVLVASCPCSLVLSVPLAYFSGIGHAARRGIVFRGGQTLDNAANIETLVFDKTGTLTSATPDFVGVILPKEQPVSRTALLDYSKAALLKSPHALARVFCEKYSETVAYQVDGVKNIGGRGLVCLIGGKKAAFGNRKLMEEIGVKVDELDKSCIYVSVDGKYCGALAFDAKIKEDALTQVSALRGNGVKRVAVMSGDNEKTVKAVAVEIGVSEYYSELKPDEKLEKLNAIYNNINKEEKSLGETVAFCGDGLNDSAVIARADVGIAMGSGSALTVESADVVIVDDNLERLNEMLAIAKKTVGVVNQNIIISLGVKIAVVLVGLIGYPSLELAVLADVGTAVVTVLNSMRAGRIKK